MPKTIDSLEVSVRPGTGSTMSGRISNEDHIYFGNAPSTVAEFFTPPTLYEYFDYDCDYCRQHALEERPWIDTEYVATRKLDIARVFMPMTAWGARMALAALCAADQKNFDGMDRLLLTQTPTTETELTGFAKKLGMKSKDFQECMHNSLRVPIGGQPPGDGPPVERVPAFQIGADRWTGILPQAELEKHLDQALRQ